MKECMFALYKNIRNKPMLEWDVYKSSSETFFSGINEVKKWQNLFLFYDC